MKRQSFHVYTSGVYRTSLDDAVVKFLRGYIIDAIIHAPREVFIRKGIRTYLARLPYINMTVQRMHRLLEDLGIDPYHVK